MSESTRVDAESLAAPTTKTVDPVTTEQVHSPARNTTVQLVTIRPRGFEGKLQVCLALHGRGATAQVYLDLGVPAMLDAVVAAGVPPFAVVAMDGGSDSYWVAKDKSDDPQRMLTEDLPTWLGNRGFATLPFAALGISMGSYGALNYARNPGLSSVAAISSALFESWTDAKSRNVFADEATWEATEPLRHIDEIRPVQLGVWCGLSDPFINQSRQLVDRARPRIAAIGTGAHDDAYWRRVLPEALRFVGETLP
ncbi:MAG: alpha/beta hydrolase [Labedaea sp.]